MPASRKGSGEGARKGYGEGAGSATGSTSPTPSPSPVSEPSPPPQEGEERELEALQKERDEYLALAQRTQADFENYRKRVVKESAVAEARGRADLATALVPVLDNLDRALAAANAEEDHLAQGVRLVRDELAAVLGRAGVESYEPTGEAFDPDWHEAMLTRPGEAGKVLEVLEKGYRLNGQVLRPARVVVGTAAPEE